MVENVSPQQPLRLLLKIDGMNCALRDGKNVVTKLQAQPGIRSAHLLFPSRSVVLHIDGSADASFVQSSALKCIQLAGYAAAPQPARCCALALVGVSCITVARRVEHLLSNHPAVLRCHLDFASRRIFLLGDGNSAPAAAAAAHAGRSLLLDALFCAPADATQELLAESVRRRPRASLWMV